MSELKKTVISEPRYFLLAGDVENWEVSLERKMWGFTDRSRGLWNTTNVGDILTFYVTLPIAKIIGFGVVSKKFIDEELIWKDEFRFKRPLWKQRINFDIIYTVGDWTNGIDLPETIRMFNSRKLLDKDLFFDFLKRGEEKWGTKLKNNKLLKEIG